MSGNQVSVDFLARTVTITDSTGATVQTYGPDIGSGHSQVLKFDPNDPKPLVGHNTVEGGRDADAMARLAVEAALPSQGAVTELLGEEAPVLPVVGLDKSALKETGREGGVGEREVVNPEHVDTTAPEQPEQDRNFGDGTDYEDWRKDALVAEAERRGLDSSGTREDIITRLKGEEVPA